MVEVLTFILIILMLWSVPALIMAYIYTRMGKKYQTTLVELVYVAAGGLILAWELLEEVWEDDPVIFMSPEAKRRKHESDARRKAEER